MYEHGTIPGRKGKYRINSKTKELEFELWPEGCHNHKEPYWHVMGSGWIKRFVTGYPTEIQKSNRLEF